MPDLTRLFKPNAFGPVNMLSVTLGVNATGSGFWPIHSLKWWAAILEVTAVTGQGVDNLSVRLECSFDNFVTVPAGGVHMQVATFQNIPGNATPTQYQCCQADFTGHWPGILSHNDLTNGGVVLPSGADSLGNAAGEYYPFGYLRAISDASTNTGTGWTYNVWLVGQGQ